MLAKKAFFVMAMLFAMAFPTASAVTSISGFTNAELLLELGKRQYSAGETLSATITVFNAEPNPIAEAYVIVEIVQGKEYYNPSQLSNVDNIFFEEKIPGINLRPGELKKIVFNYTLPENIAAGDYRIDAYFKNAMSNAVGAPHIFVSPKTARFTVQASGNWPRLKIVRTKTEFNGKLGPVGPPTEPGSTIKGRVFIENTSSERITNATLFVGMCDWDDTACNNFNPSRKITIDSIEANSEKEISVELPAPTLPSAYAIRLEARHSGKLESLYRNRSIIVGPTARVRKLSISNFKFAAGETAQISAVIGPTPDHYTYPVFTDFYARVWIEDLEKGKTVFSGSRFFKTISIQEVRDNYPEEKFSFTAQEQLTHFKLCGSIEKNNAVFDSQCIEFDASKFSEAKKEPQVKVSWQYDYAKKELQLQFCNEPKETALNAEYFLIEKGATLPLVEGKLFGTECVKKNVPAAQSTFELLITDFNSKRQSKTTITIKELEISTLAEKSCAELNGRECPAGEQCKTQTLAVKDIEKCCTTICEKVVSQIPIEPLAGWIVIAIILIALLAIVGVWVKKR